MQTLNYRPIYFGLSCETFRENIFSIRKILFCERDCNRIFVNYLNLIDGKSFRIDDDRCGLFKVTVFKVFETLKKNHVHFFFSKSINRIKLNILFLFRIVSIVFFVVH